MYKKFLAAALAVTMVLGLAGCGGSGGSTQAASSQEKESSAAPAGSTGESTTAQAEGADAPAVIKSDSLHLFPATMQPTVPSARRPADDCRCNQRGAS